MKKEELKKVINDADTFVIKSITEIEKVQSNLKPNHSEALDDFCNDIIKKLEEVQEDMNSLMEDGRLEGKDD